MRRTLTTLLTVGLMSVTPGLVGNAFAHGGSYRGPAGEVPPDSREPTDPPPPADPGGPQTPGGDGPDGPTTGGDVGGGPTTGDGDGDGPPPTPGGGTPPPTAGGGPGGPATGGPGGRKPGGGAKGPGYEDWTFWWNFNKDEIIQLKSVVKKRQVGTRTGSIVHDFGRDASGGSTAVQSTTDAAIKNKILPALRDLMNQDGLNFDIQSASAIALAKIGDETIVDGLKNMARNDGKGYHKVVRESAGLAFGLLQKDTEDVRNFLIEVIQNKDLDASFVRPFSAISLGLLGDKNDPDGTSAAALMQIIKGKEKKGEIKPAALVALGLLGNDAVVNDLLFMLENGKVDAKDAEDLSDVEIAFVVQALGKIGKPGLAADGKQTAVIDKVLAVLDGKKKDKADRRVRYSAAIALGQLAPQCDADKQSEILATLKAIATDKVKGSDSSERNFAMISLGRVGATEGISDKTRGECISTLRYLLDKARPKGIAQPYAGLGLGLIGRQVRAEGKPTMEEDINKPLREKFDEMKEARARGSFAIASGLVGDKLAVKQLVETLSDSGADNKLRGYCAVALGLIGARDGQDAIKSALTTETNRDLRVQTAVAAGLIGDAGVIQSLVDILESGEESQYILGSVALSLGQIGDERSIDPLVNIAMDSKKKFPDLTRALATVALGQIGDRRDVPVLSRVARDFNYRALVPSLAELLTIL